MSHNTIGELAELAGISVRTLHHYDAIGLLSPTTRASNGYRYYNESDAERLHTILFYRALGFSLAKIATLLQSAPLERRQLLRQQQEQLNQHSDRLTRMKCQLELEIESISQATEDYKMSKQNRFAVFEGFDPDEYAEETKANWGETDAYRESARRTREYSKADWQRYKTESDQLNQQLIALIKKDKRPNDAEVLAVVDQMRLLIDTWFYPCSKQMHASLGDMYVADERFKVTYEKLHEGMAEFMQQATRANLNCDENRKGD